MATRGPGGGGAVEVLEDGVSRGTATQIDFIGQAAVTFANGRATVDVTGGAHPDLAAHDTLGLATQAELDAHAGAADPHPTYTTSAEAASIAAGEVATHAAAADPHTGYRREDQDHSHASAGLQGGQVAHSALSGVGANDHHGQAHAIGGADHTGTLAHAALGSIGANDHHTENHASRHGPAQADALKLDDLAAPDDNTDLNASASAHGLMQKYPGGTTTFLRADGAFATPTASIAAPFTGDQAPGSFTIATGQFGIHGKRLALTTTQRATIAGTGRLSVYN